MADLATLISEAQGRAQEREQAYMRQNEIERKNSREQLEGHVSEAFGNEIAATLGLEYQADPDRAWAIFTYQDKRYSLRSRRDEYGREWFLTRLDPRETDDHRQLPSDRFMQSSRDQQGNLDKLLLALVELAAQPETSSLSAIEYSSIAPRVMNEYEANLLDALRVFLQSEL